MTLAKTIAAALADNDWDKLVGTVPFARFLGLRLDIKGDQFTCILPYAPKLIGNPVLPALHGGATGGFLECAAIFYQLWHRDTAIVPKTINFNLDYLRPGKPQDTYAHVYMVKLGQRVANIRAEAWQTDPDKQIAIAHGNFLLQPEIH